MKRTIKIGDRDVEMLANAASPYIFRTLFGQDFIKESQNPDPDVHLMEKMGFVMAMQAELPIEKLFSLDIKDFYKWLVGFDPLDVLGASEEIGKLYRDQAKNYSEPKK